jgi:thiol-disulfide isomerase/thioredoxin
MRYNIVIALVSLLTVVGCRELKNTNESKTLSAPIASTLVANEEQNPTTAMPSFKMLTVDNKMVNLSSLKGKKVFVNLWATWCPPCRAEIPSIEKLATKTDKNKVAFVMLALDNQFEKAISYAAKNKMALPIYYPAENLPPLINVEGIPTTFVFDEQGKLIHQQVGSVDYNTSKYVNMLTK